MKNFTCLVVALLAIGMINSQACGGAAAIDNNLLQRFDALTTGTSIATASVATTAGQATCVADLSKMCCDVTKLKTVVGTELTALKTAITDIGVASARLGVNWAKIAALASTQGDAIAATTTLPELAGLTGAQLKAVSNWTLMALDAEFVKFKEQAVGCFAHLSTFTQRLACFACQEAATTGAVYNTAVKSLNSGTGITINVATCAAAVTACSKVWNYAHKFGTYIHAIALANKLKGAAAVTFTPGAANTHYSAGANTATALTYTEIDTALPKCIDGAAATTCLDADEAILCRAFIAPFAAANKIGRSGSAYFVPAYNFVSAQTRRALVAIGTSEVAVADATGMDLVIGTFAGAAVVVAPTTAVTLLAAEITAWSTGYMAAAAGAGGNNTTVNNTTVNNTSNMTTKKSAKIVFGTIISAILAVALLN